MTRLKREMMIHEKDNFDDSFLLFQMLEPRIFADPDLPPGKSFELYSKLRTSQDLLFDSIAIGDEWTAITNLLPLKDGRSRVRFAFAFAFAIKMKRYDVVWYMLDLSLENSMFDRLICCDPMIVYMNDLPDEEHEDPSHVYKRAQKTGSQSMIDLVEEYGFSS